MAKQIKEATETIVKVVRISGKTKPLAINGKENTDNVVFLRAFDAESGAKLDTPLSITESRAKMFGFSCLCISEETAERDNAGNMVEELNTLANPPKYYEMTLRVIPKGEPGEWGYKTKPPSILPQTLRAAWNAESPCCIWYQWRTTPEYAGSLLTDTLQPTPFYTAMLYSLDNNTHNT